MWSLLADAVVVVHLAYLLFVLLGGFLALRHLGWLVPHLAVVTWGVVGVVRSASCPLTDLEKWLRMHDGGLTYSTTFIGHYLDGPVWPEGASGQVWLATAGVVLAAYVMVGQRYLQERESGLQARH